MKEELAPAHQSEVSEVPEVPQTTTKVQDVPAVPETKAVHAVSQMKAEPGHMVSEQQAAQTSLLPKNPGTAAAGPIPLPVGVSETTFKSGKDRAVAWGRYDRSLKSGASKSHIASDASRSSRSEKADDHFLAQLAGAHEKAFYFQVWLHCKSWATVRIFEEHYHEERSLYEQSEAWVTAGQMQEIWHDPDVVSGLTQWARTQTDRRRVRPHPKIPHIEAAVQFLVPVEERYQKQTLDVVRRGTRYSLSHRCLMSILFLN